VSIQTPGSVTENLRCEDASFESDDLILLFRGWRLLGFRMTDGRVDRLLCEIRLAAVPHDGDLFQEPEIGRRQRSAVHGHAAALIVPRETGGRVSSAIVRIVYFGHSELHI
jgi:hypothetical protein